MKLNARKIATVVAALTDLQEKLRVSGAEQVRTEYGDHFDAIEPLSVEQIDELINEISGEKQEKVHYLVRVEGDVEPSIYMGPEPEFDTILEEAKVLREESDEDGLYVLIIDEDGKPEISSFGCLDPDEEEEEETGLEPSH